MCNCRAVYHQGLHTGGMTLLGDVTGMIWPASNVGGFPFRSVEMVCCESKSLGWFASSVGEGGGEG